MKDKRIFFILSILKFILFLTAIDQVTFSQTDNTNIAENTLESENQFSFAGNTAVLDESIDNMSEGAEQVVGENVTEGAEQVVGENVTEGDEQVVGENVTEGAEQVVGENVTEGAEQVVGENVTEGAEQVVGENVTEGAEQLNRSNEGSQEKEGNIFDQILEGLGGLFK